MTSQSYPKIFPEVPPVADPFVSEVGASIAGLLDFRGSPQRVIMGLSGGPDSTALLAALVALRQKLGLSITVVHINHGLRGDDSLADESFCRSLAEHWQIEFSVEKLEGLVSDEESLRNARYAAFVAAAEARGAAHVLTGHTLDDQSETLLFRLFRGTGPTGLTGIPKKRSLTPKITVIRPLLELHRTEIESFLARAGIEARIDKTNLESLYKRNYIRNEILPLIEREFPNFADRMENLRVLLAEDSGLLTGMAKKAERELPLDDDFWLVLRLLSQPTALQRRLVAGALSARDIEVSFDRIDGILQLVNSGKGAMTLNEQWEVRIDSNRLRWNRIDEQAYEPISCEMELRPAGLTILASLGCAIHIEDCEITPRDFPRATAFEAVVNLQSVEQPLVVRTRRAGDVIQPFGMKEMVRLKKFLHTHERADNLCEATIVIANSDEVLWVPGVGISEKIRVRTNPSHQLRFSRLALDEMTLV